MKFFTLFWMLMLTSIAVFAQVASPSPSGNAALHTINHVSSVIPTSIPVWLVGAIGVACEFLIRAIPTAKPRSLFLLVSSFFKSIGGLFDKISSLLDMVVQNLKDGQ